ncbi:MAG: hypothetical protein FWG20_05765 [Candidatus Cloacimonetes bacterium]|nr:hypothetical protein [Candidatus Cloacimonadota bacterium]
MKSQAYIKKSKQIVEMINELVENMVSVNIDQSYKKFFDDLRKIINYEHASIFLLQKGDTKPTEVASTGKSLFFMDNNSPNSIIKSTNLDDEDRSLLMMNDIKIITQLNDLNLNYSDLHIGSFLSMLLCLKNGNVGIINFAHSKKWAFSEQEIELLERVKPFIEEIISNNLSIESLEGYNSDIIELQKKMLDTQQHLVEAERKIAISATTASLNHEINNPLMIMSGYTQLMIEYLSHDPDSQSKLIIIDSQITRIKEILTNLRQIEDPLFENYITDNSVQKMLVLEKKKK